MSSRKNVINVDDGNFSSEINGTAFIFKDIEAMLIGKTIEEAKALKEDYLKAYAERMVLTRGRVSAEYRKSVCMNLLEEFLTKFGI